MITFPPSSDPLVSVVMVTYGRWDWSSRALRAVLEATDEAYEVIVVDNASPDETPDRLREEVRGAKVTLNERNVGFGSGANQGARDAAGRYLCFLNPDTLVRRGWLRPLVAVLERHGWAGAVAPRFLNLDGTVQEAGSVVDRHGWTFALGAGADPGDPEFRFRRVVDYASAACLLIERSIFERAGGFDPAYFPAYCEDVDLSFSLRESGLRTVLEPRSSVVHAGAGSTDDATRVRLIERNRPRLLGRWGDRLSDRPPLAELDVHPHRLVALRDAWATERFLLIDDRPPSVGPTGAGRLGRLAREMAATWPDSRVTLLSEGREPGDQEELLAAGVEVVHPLDPYAWLEHRRFHYTAIIADGPATLDDAVRGTQPQAARASTAGSPGGPEPRIPPPSDGEGTMDRPRPELVAALTALGAAPPGLSPG